jgi:hypothetical protein
MQFLYEDRNLELRNINPIFDQYQIFIKNFFNFESK